MKKKIAILGIVDVGLYAVIVFLYLIFKSEQLLTLWEAITILSAPVMLLILLDILKNSSHEKSVFQNLTIVFMTCTIVLTSVAHFVNITVTRKLIEEGVNIPTYFQIGYWPSVEMSIDYLAWGFFMGLAFITTACPLHMVDSLEKRLKIMLFACGSLCLLGFFGTILVNENFWYLAPQGYGVGIMIVCIVMLQGHKKRMLNYDR